MAKAKAKPDGNDDGWEAVPRFGSGGQPIDVRHTVPLLRVRWTASKGVHLQSNTVAAWLLAKALPQQRLVLLDGGPGRLALRAPREGDAEVNVRTLSLPVYKAGCGTFARISATGVLWLARGDVFGLRPPDEDGLMILEPVSEDFVEYARPGRGRVPRSGLRWSWDGSGGVAGSPVPRWRGRGLSPPPVP
jgi:hypothetical protein